MSQLQQEESLRLELDRVTAVAGQVAGGLSVEPGLLQLGWVAAGLHLTESHWTLAGVGSARRGLPRRSQVRRAPWRGPFSLQRARDNYSSVQITRQNVDPLNGHTARTAALPSALVTLPCVFLSVLPGGALEGGAAVFTAAPPLPGSAALPGLWPVTGGAGAGAGAAAGVLAFTLPPMLRPGMRAAMEATEEDPMGTTGVFLGFAEGREGERESITSALLQSILHTNTHVYTPSVEASSSVPVFPSAASSLSPLGLKDASGAKSPPPRASASRSRSS